MNILIAEDDKMQRENLRKMIEGINPIFNIYEAEDKEEALKILNSHNIELFYIDIFLKNSSGLELALEIRKISKYELSWIIFLTTHIEYLTQALKQVHCYDYIIKPYNKDDIVNSTNLIFTRSCSNDEIKRQHAIFNLKAGITIKIYVDEIIFIEVSMRTCTIHSKKGKYQIKGLCLKDALKLINSNDIVQCHKSIAVNIKYIIKIEKVLLKSYEISFENYEEKVALSNNFKNIIMERFKGAN